MDKKLHFQDHIKYIRQKSLTRIRQIYPIISSQTLTLRQKTTIYKGLIRPIILYASPAWGYTTRAQMQTLQTIQNRYARIITGSDRFTQIALLHDCLGLQYIKEVITEQAKKLKDKYSTHTNNIIRAIGTTQTIRHSTYRTPHTLTQ